MQLYSLCSCTASAGIRQVDDDLRKAAGAFHLQAVPVGKGIVGVDVDYCRCKGDGPTDIAARLDTVEACVDRVESLSAGRVEKYTQRLYERLKVILEDRSIDDARVLTEAAIFGDKTAVDEETVRLRSHIAQYREILGSDQPVGRKLDFLTQELNREANTIGSKCQDLDITRVVVDMKAEIEKIREQIQNLE